MDNHSDRVWSTVVLREAARKGAVYPWNLFSYSEDDSYRPTATATFPHASRETSYVEGLSKASTCDYLGATPSPVGSPAKTEKLGTLSPQVRDDFTQTSERQPGSLSRVLGADSCNPYLRFPSTSSGGSKRPRGAEASLKSPPLREKDSVAISQRYLREPTEGTPHLQQTLSAADLVESEKSKLGEGSEDLDGSLRNAIEFLQLLGGEAGSEPTTEKLQSRLGQIESRFGTKGKTVALKIIQDLSREPLNATYSDKFSGVVTWGEIGIDHKSLTLPKPSFGSSWNEEMKNVTTTLGTFMGAVRQLRNDLSSLRAAASHLK